MFLSGKAFKWIRARQVRSTCETPRPEPHAANGRSIENLPPHYKHGTGPVDGATGVPYARRSAHGKDAFGSIHCFRQTVIRLSAAKECRPTAIFTGTLVVDEIHLATSVSESGSALVDVSASGAYCDAYG